MLTNKIFKNYKNLRNKNLKNLTAKTEIDQEDSSSINFLVKNNRKRSNDSTGETSEIDQTNSPPINYTNKERNKYVAIKQKRIGVFQKINHKNDLESRNNQEENLNYHLSPHKCISKPPRCPTQLEKASNKRVNAFYKNSVLKLHKLHSKNHRRTLTLSVFQCEKSYKIPKLNNDSSLNKSPALIYKHKVNKFSLKEDDEHTTQPMLPGVNLNIQNIPNSASNKNIELRTQVKLDFESFKDYIYSMKKKDGPCDQILYDDKFIMKILKKKLNKQRELMNYKKIK